MEINMLSKIKELRNDLMKEYNGINIPPHFMLFWEKSARKQDSLKYLIKFMTIMHIKS